MIGRDGKEESRKMDVGWVIGSRISSRSIRASARAPGPSSSSELFIVVFVVVIVLRWVNTAREKLRIR